METSQEVERLRELSKKIVELINEYGRASHLRIEVVNVDYGTNDTIDVMLKTNRIEAGSIGQASELS